MKRYLLSGTCLFALVASGVSCSSREGIQVKREIGNADQINTGGDEFQCGQLTIANPPAVLFSSTEIPLTQQAYLCVYQDDYTELYNVNGMLRNAPLPCNSSLYGRPVQEEILPPLAPNPHFEERQDGTALNLDPNAITQTPYLESVCRFSDDKTIAHVNYHMFVERRDCAPSPCAPGSTGPTTPTQMQTLGVNYYVQCLAESTPTPTPIPTASPTPEPTASPTPEPTASPTPEPTASPTPVPTLPPTPSPTPSACDPLVQKFVLSDFTGTHMQVQVTFREGDFILGDNGQHEIKFEIAIMDQTADLVGAFFNIADDSLLTKLGATVTEIYDAGEASPLRKGSAAASYLTASKFGPPNSVSKIGAANITPASFDAGLSFGKEGIGKNKGDVRIVEFIVDHPLMGLTIANQFAGQKFGVRATSVVTGNTRSGSSKLEGIIPGACKQK